MDSDIQFQSDSWNMPPTISIKSHLCQLYPHSRMNQMETSGVAKKVVLVFHVFSPSEVYQISVYISVLALCISKLLFSSYSCRKYVKLPRKQNYIFNHYIQNSSKNNSDCWIFTNYNTANTCRILHLLTYNNIIANACRQDCCSLLGQ